MNSYNRNPKWTVIIKRPDYTKPTLTFKRVPEWSKTGNLTSIITFNSSQDTINAIYGYTDLIGYEYDESIANVENPFSLTLVPEQDSKGLTWKDKIRARDIVYIKEFDKIRYIGVVKNTGYSSSMDNAGNPNRSIVVSGESIGGMIKSFNLPMNIYLWFNLGADAQTKNDLLAASLNSLADEGQSIGNIFSSIKDAFFGVVFGKSQSGFQALIDEYFTLEVSGLEAFYPMNIRPFQEDSNNLWTIFRQITPGPIYELFGKFENNKYKLICRETPFDYSDWNSLKITEINPLFLNSQNLSDSDSEVYTHYFSQLPNSVLSKNEIYANSSLDEISVFDEEKLSIYGYRQLEATFPFYDIDKGRSESSIGFLKENSVRLYDWYRNNVDFLSGDIELMTVPDSNNEYISIGERIKYLQGSSNSIQFYVERVKRKMEFPGVLTSTYGVTRGYEYGSSNITIDGISRRSPQVKRISQQGKKLIQSEKEVLFEGGLR